MFFFFFSSRRRHTRLQGDWSSDVCSSDLGHQVSPGSKGLEDRAGTGLLGEPHDDGPEPVWDEEYDQPSEIDHETLASGYGARGGEGSAGGSTRPSALSNCPSGGPPSGTSASTTAKRRLSSGSRIAWAANCSVRGMRSGERRVGEEG